MGINNTVWLCGLCKQLVQRNFNSIFYCDCLHRWQYEVRYTRAYPPGSGFSYTWPGKWERG